VDESFLQLAIRLVEEGTYPALATHDDRLIDAIIGHADRRGIPADRYEFQMLYGIRRELQGRLIGDGYRVRLYVPYGTQWYPYYMRRLAERPANVLFILRSIVRPGG
jgi:proline dehydrogenase